MSTNSTTAVTLPAPSQNVSGPKARVVDDATQLTDQKDLFLKLMIAQLRNQDPTAPMDSKDMMASMTQMSQVEQMQNMTKAMETLSLAQGVNMVGNYVSYRYKLTDQDGNNVVDQVRYGQVVSVEQKAGSVELMLSNGVRVKPSDVQSVSATPTPPQTLVGKYVDYRFTGHDADGKEVTMTLTGKVTSLAGEEDALKLVVAGRQVDPADVIAVSDVPSKTATQSNPPAGVS